MNAQKVPSMTRTTAIDAILTGTEPLVQIGRYPIDMQNLADDVGRRVVATLERAPVGCLYFNPAITVACSTPTEKFFEAVRREQARWCRQAARTFPRAVRRRVSRWFDCGESKNNKFTRYLDRGLCFTGILFIDGVIMPSHVWPKPNAAKTPFDLGLFSRSQSATHQYPEVRR